MEKSLNNRSKNTPWWDDLFSQALAKTFSKTKDGKVTIYFEPMETLLKLVEKTAKVEVANDCYLECLREENGEGACAEAIRTKLPNFVVKYTPKV